MEIGEHYRRGRVRLVGLLGDVGADAWPVPVAACPGWRVHDVVGHLVGIVEDALAGRITGPATEAQTATQVERHRDDRPEQMLAVWDELAGSFEQLITGFDVWPAAVDMVTHEHDVRAALGRPGARDDELVLAAARQMVEGLEVEGTVTVELGRETVRSTPRPGPDYVLRTSAFELFRLRMGRRSRSQVAELDWSRDPGDVLDALFIFGPAEAPLVE